MNARRHAALLLLALAACDPAGAPEVTFEVADSAGVQIVHNHWSERDAPRILLGDAILRLGSEQRGPQLFGTVTWVGFSPDNTVWIGDGSVQELRGFSLPSGDHLFTIGREGDGPVEFRGLSPLDFDEQGRLWVWDRRLGRLTILGSRGETAEMRSLATKYEFVPLLRARTPRGNYLAQLPQSSVGAIAEGTSFRDTVRVWEIDDNASPAKLWTERGGVRWYFTGRAQYAVPFTPSAQFAARGDRVAITNAEGEPSFEIFENGKLMRRVTVDRERALVTRADIDAELSGRPEDEAAFLKLHLAEIGVPDSKPTWDRYPILSPDGHFFAVRSGTLLKNQTWDAFDRAGKQLGVLQLEDGDRLMEVGDRYLAVLETDSRGVGRVAVHPLPAVLSGASNP